MMGLDGLLLANSEWSNGSDLIVTLFTTAHGGTVEATVQLCALLNQVPI